MRKIISILFITILTVFVFLGCSQKDELQIPDNSPYNFMSYEDSQNIVDIEKLTLGGEFGKSCASYKFTYLSDNIEVKGYISIPINCIETQTPYKCLIYNRGGNSRIGFLGNEDTARICVATNRVVVASQYRGADGGDGRDEFGGNDLNDVIKLIDLCENTFKFADISDLCVVGVSRGGMMSYMAARKDSRIKGVIAVSAVSDLFKAYDKREDMKTLLNNYIGGSPQQLPEEYTKRSAICWADEIKVPVLIIHSKADEQVSFSQAEELSNEFKLCNVDYTMIEYDDGVHGFHREDANKISLWLSENFK